MDKVDTKTKIKYSKQAGKFLKKQTKATQIRIVKAILKIPTGDIKISTVQGHKDLLKIRIGDFRVIFDKDFAQIIEVKKIGNRGDIYNEY